MRWSKLFIPTLREEPTEGDPRLRIFVRAGYARSLARGIGYLPLGQRSLAKIAALVRRELDAVGGQEVALGESGANALIAAIRGGMKSYRQFPQLWYQQQGFSMEACGFEVQASEIRAAVKRAIAACGLEGIVDDPDREFAPEEFHTPGVKTIADIAAFTGMPESSQIKSVVMMCGGELVLVLVRGDHVLSEAKLRTIVEGTVRAATADEIREKFGADPGSLGPVGLTGVRILADEALRGRRNMISGANRTDYHLRHVTPSRDFSPQYADLRVATEGAEHTGVPIVVNEMSIGSAGEPEDSFVFLQLALDRLLSVAARRDELGLIMPPPVAPFSVVFTPVNVRDDGLRSAAEQLYKEAKAAGCDALLDDRDERPGVKFKDAELIGVPWRVTVGKKLTDGFVEVFERHDKSTRDVPVDNAVMFVRDRWDAVV